MKKNYQVVKKLLEEHQKCRDSDKALIWMFWRETGVLSKYDSSLNDLYNDYLSLSGWKTATPASTIVRARREVQADYPYLRGRKYQERQKQSTSMKSKNNRYKYYEGKL